MNNELVLKSTEKETSSKSLFQKMIRFFENKKVMIGVMMYLIASNMSMQIAYADETSITPTPVTSADSLWSIAINTYVAPWIKRIGGVVALFGGYNALMGWKNNNHDQRDQGFTALAIGAAIVSLGYGVAIFLV